MGSASSKAAKTAAGAASRQYPTRVPNNLPPSNPTTPQTSSYTSPIISTSTQAARASQPAAANGTTTDPPPSSSPEAVSDSRTTAVERDASDPHFAASLRQLGPVTPSSTRSNSSTFSSTIARIQYSSSPSSLTTTASNASSQPAATHQPPPQHLQHQAAIFPAPSQNPALLIFQARERIAAEAEREMSSSITQIGPNSGGVDRQQRGRRFLDVGTIREALMLRDSQGLSGAEIEERLGLREGVMGFLGRVGEARMGKVDAGDTGLD